MDYKCRQFDMVEIKLKSSRSFPLPFLEVNVYCRILGPDHKEVRLKGFYDGDDTWVVRFTPWMQGTWTFEVTSFPKDEGLEASGSISAGKAAEGEKGFIRAGSDTVWGLSFDSGDELLIIGDTMYNLLGVAYCGGDIRKVLEHRKKQGFNFIRAKMVTSSYHNGFTHGDWETRPLWLWGGNPQMPQYWHFNLEYFKAVDSVMQLLHELDMGLEFIITPFGYELPITDRTRFLPEYQELFIRYVTARYSACTSVYIWNVANEYNLYTNADQRHFNSPVEELVANRFAGRVASLIRESDAYGHPIGVHDTASGSTYMPFKDRFGPEDCIDVLLYQTWGDVSTQRGKDMAAGLENKFRVHVEGSGRVNILAEYGYEIYPGSTDCVSFHDGLGPDHTRRGAWRTLFSGLHVISGFENTFYMFFRMEREPEGAGQLIHLRNFFEKTVDFRNLRPDKSLLSEAVEKEKAEDEKTLCMRDDTGRILAAYLPAGGKVGINIQGKAPREAFWYDTMTGSLHQAVFVQNGQNGIELDAPSGLDCNGNAKDWALVVRSD